MHGAFVAGAAGDDDNHLGSGSEGYYQGDSDAGVVERRLDRAAAAVVGYRRRLHEVAALMLVLLVVFVVPVIPFAWLGFVVLFWRSFDAPAADVGC